MVSVNATSKSNFPSIALIIGTHVYIREISQEKKEGIDICPFVLLQVKKNITEVPNLNVFQVILQLDL